MSEEGGWFSAGAQGAKLAMLETEVEAGRTEIVALKAELQRMPLLSELRDEIDHQEVVMARLLRGGDVSTKRLEYLEAAFDRVRKLHVKYGIYDECEHFDGDDESSSHEGREPTHIEDLGWTCAEPTQFVCRECDTDDGECNENTEYGEWPCATLKALEAP